MNLRLFLKISKFYIDIYGDVKVKDLIDKSLWQLYKEVKQ